MSMGLIDLVHGKLRASKVKMKVTELSHCETAMEVTKKG